MKKLILILPFLLAFASITNASGIVHKSTGAIRANLSPTTSLTNGLIGYWTFDGKDTNWTSATAGTTNDLSGQGNTGTLTSMNQSTTPVSGVFGQGLNFVSAVPQYVDITGLTSDTNFIGASNVTFSASLWFKTSTNTFQVLLSKESLGNASGFDIDIDIPSTGSGTFGARWKANGSPQRFSNGNYADGKWHHGVVIVTANTSSSAGQDVQVYVDGKADNGTLVNTTFASAAGAVSLKIGARTTLANSANANIDDVRIYNRGLSAYEIDQLYRAGGGLKVSVSPTSYLTDGLTDYWTFDGKNMIGTVQEIASSTANNLLIPRGYATSTTAGRLGQAITFDGSALAYASSTMQAMNLASSNFSVCLWMNTPTNFNAGAGSKNQTMFSSTVSSVNWFNLSIGSGANGGKIISTAEVGGGSNLTQITNAIQVATSTWTHICTTQTGVAAPIIYKNGVLAASGSGSNLTPTTKTARTLVGSLGGGFDSNEGAYMGAIDDVRVYNKRVLSAYEVQQLYLSGR